MLMVLRREPSFLWKLLDALLPFQFESCVNDGGSMHTSPDGTSRVTSLGYQLQSIDHLLHLHAYPLG
jgi:hypothetical protein